MLSHTMYKIRYFVTTIECIYAIREYIYIDSFEISVRWKERILGGHNDNAFINRMYVCMYV